MKKLELQTELLSLRSEIESLNQVKNSDLQAQLRRASKEVEEIEIVFLPMADPGQAASTALSIPRGIVDHVKKMVSIYGIDAETIG